MFGNVINDIKFGNEIMMSRHTIYETFRHLEVGQQGLLIFIVVFFICLIFTDILWIVSVCCPRVKPDDNFLEGLADWPRCF